MFLPILTMLAPQAGLTNPQSLQLPAAVKAPRMTPAVRRAFLARELPNVKPTTDLSETIVLDLRSTPPKGSYLRFHKVELTTEDEGRAVMSRIVSESTQMYVRFPAKKGSAYAVVVVGRSTYPSAEGYVAFANTPNTSVSATIAPKSESFALAFVSPRTGTAELVLYPPNAGGAYSVLSIQRVEITRLT